ncbi:MAG: flagellar basal body rod protein FlgC [Provencibacterium sp.]|jgi:flagellar basal-body rod protein FlgC|nr:flagellar basal body rod protein FlgC [Provencibacterium sp.]
MLSSLSIAGSALTAERYRMNVALQNLANISTTRSAEDGEPYRRKQVVFEERAVDFKKILENEQGKVNGGVRVAEVISSDRDFIPVYDPTHPDANEEGYVMYPNVNRAEEQVDLMAASRAYEANLTALNVIKSTALKALEIGK